MIQRSLRGLLLFLFSLHTINIYAYIRFNEVRLLKVAKCRWGESHRLEETSSLKETRVWWGNSEISRLRNNQSWVKELVGAFALGTLATNDGSVREENILSTGQFYRQLLDPSLQDFELSLADVGSTIIFTYAWMLSQQVHHNSSIPYTESSLKHDSSLKRFLHYLEENIFNSSISNNNQSQFYQEIEEYLEESKARRGLVIKDNIEERSNTATVILKPDPVAVLSSIIKGNIENDEKIVENSEDISTVNENLKLFREKDSNESLNVAVEKSFKGEVLGEGHGFPEFIEENAKEEFEALTSVPEINADIVDEMNESQGADEYDEMDKDDKQAGPSSPLCFESVDMSEYQWLHAPFKNQATENTHSTRLDELQQIIKREYQAFPPIKDHRDSEDNRTTILDSDEDDQATTDDEETQPIPSERKRMRSSESKEFLNLATPVKRTNSHDPLISDEKEIPRLSSSLNVEPPDTSSSPSLIQTDPQTEMTYSSSPKSAYSTAAPSISGMKWKPPPKRKSIKDALFGSSTTEYLQISQQLGFQRTHRHSAPYSSSPVTSSFPSADTSHPHYQRYTSKQEQIEQLLERSLPHSYDHSQHLSRHPVKTEPFSVPDLTTASNVPSQVTISVNSDIIHELPPSEVSNLEEKHGKVDLVAPASSSDKMNNSTQVSGWEDENDDEDDDEDGNSENNKYEDESGDDSDWSYFHNYPPSVQVDLNQVKIRSQISWNQLRNSGSSIYESAQKRFKKENQQYPQSSIREQVRVNSRTESTEVPMSKSKENRETVKRVDMVLPKQKPSAGTVSNPKPVSQPLPKKSSPSPIQELPSIPAGSSPAASSKTSPPTTVRDSINVTSPASYLPLVSSSIKELIETINSTTSSSGNSKEEGVITIKNMMEKDKKKQVNELIASSKEKFSKFNFFPSKIKVDDVPSNEQNGLQSLTESTSAGVSSTIDDDKKDTVVYSSGLNDTMSDFGLRTFIMETPRESAKEMKGEEEKLVATQRALKSIQMNTKNPKRKLVRVNDRYVYMNDDDNN